MTRVLRLTLHRTDDSLVAEELLKAGLILLLALALRAFVASG